MKELMVISFMYKLYKPCSKDAAYEILIMIKRRALKCISFSNLCKPM